MSEGIYGSEGFYYGENSSLSPENGNYSGYKIKNGNHNLGFPGGIQTANQLNESVNAIKQGAMAFEVTMLTADMAETIPKQHFKEMRQLMKLSGVKPSVHGPMIDAAGFLPEGKGWGGEEVMEDNQRRMFGTIEKAYELNPNGNIPVVFHSSGGIPGGEWRPDGKGGKIQESLIAINQSTGQMVPMKRKRKFGAYVSNRNEKGTKTLTENEFNQKVDNKFNIKDPNKGGVLFEPKDQIGSANATDWDKRMTELATFNKHASELIGSNPATLMAHTGLEKEKFNAVEIEAIGKINQADIFLDNVQLNFNSAFETAFEFGTEEQRKDLKVLAKNYSKEMNGIKQVDILHPVQKHEILNNSIKELSRITDVIEDKKTGYGMSGAPQIYTDVESFASDKTAQTFGNLAMKSYDKYKKNSPMIVIENMPQGMAFASGKQMVEVVKGARKQFVKRLVDDKKMSEKAANKMAEEKIGMTWDVGHINIMKKSGFTDEDIVEETKTVKDYVKHIHLTDNFGFADTHLAPGMGNVPFKEIMAELEKNGEYDQMSKIIEAGVIPQHFKKSPFPSALAGMGSQIYGAKMETYWSEAQASYGGYFGGYGAINPQVHHSLYGSGFTNLPMEFGGQVSQGGSRFSGNSMA